MAFFLQLFLHDLYSKSMQTALSHISFKPYPHYIQSPLIVRSLTQDENPTFFSYSSEIPVHVVCVDLFLSPAVHNFYHPISPLQAFPWYHRIWTNLCIFICVYSKCSSPRPQVAWRTNSGVYYTLTKSLVIYVISNAWPTFQIFPISFPHLVFTICI